MKIPFVDLHAQYLTIKEEIDGAIAEVIAESAFSRGRHVEAFEQAWARTLGVKRCVSCANGTDAIYIALRGLGLRSGDEVITSAHSWISTKGPMNVPSPISQPYRFVGSMTVTFAPNLTSANPTMRRVTGFMSQNSHE